MSSIENTSRRKFSARVFTRAAAICPRCRGRIKRAAASCPQCEFDLGVCEKLFPFAAPPLGLVIDPSRLLPKGIERDLASARQKLRKRFPQVEVSFCFVRLQAGIATQEFAFWLHNSAPEADEARAWQLLVVGDLTSGRLALTVGYAIEPFIKDELWEAALQELAACIADGEWKEGLNGFLSDARNLLSSAWQRAEQRRLKNERKLEEQRRSKNERNLEKARLPRSEPRQEAASATEGEEKHGRPPVKVEEPANS